MMRFRPSLALLLLFSFAVSFGAVEQAVLLRRKLIPNDEMKYKMETAVKTDITLPDGSNAPESEVSVTGDYSIKTGDRVKDGKLPVVISASNLEMTSSDQESKSGPQPDLTMKGFIDERGTMTDVAVESADERTKQTGAMMSTMINGMSGFPEKAVQPGDTWSITLPLSNMGMKDMELTMKYDGTRTEDGQQYWVVHVDQDVPMEIDLAAMARASGQPADSNAPAMTLKGTMHVTVEALYDMNGRPHNMLSEDKSDMRVDGPQGGQVQIHTDQVMKMTQVK